jgi:hypothetical protein
MSVLLFFEALDQGHSSGLSTSLAFTGFLSIYLLIR